MFKTLEWFEGQYFDFVSQYLFGKSCQMLCITNNGSAAQKHTVNKPRIHYQLKSLVHRPHQLC